MKDNLLIYFAPDCHECEFIQNYLRQHNIDIKTEFLSLDDRIEKGIFIFPALLENEMIIAYGEDIINYLVN